VSTATAKKNVRQLNYLNAQKRKGTETHYGNHTNRLYGKEKVFIVLIKVNIATVAREAVAKR